MRTRTALSVAVATITAASLTFLACSKEEDEEEEGLSAEQKADGNKAASAATSKVLASSQEGANLKGQQLKHDIRALYMQAKEQKRQMLAMQDDDTQEDPFDQICTYFTKSCEEDLNKEKPAEADGQICKTTSCTGGTTDTCSSPSQTTQCGGTTYTMSESTLAYTTTCSKVAARKFNLAIAANFAGTLSGGSLTTGVKLECKINVAFPLDFTAEAQQSQGSEDEEDAELSCEDGQFSCTLDGEALSCEELKAAIKDSPCD